ncbi:hypothetical protein C8Q79DRAFT_1007501 [Trametes meyenii]|nr:hypothetical protein C8Q79DRAFT_1007501 [Trametes meyenii]
MSATVVPVCLILLHPAPEKPAACRPLSDPRWPRYLTSLSAPRAPIPDRLIPSIPLDQYLLPPGASRRRVSTAPRRINSVRGRRYPEPWMTVRDAETGRYRLVSMGHPSDVRIPASHASEPAVAPPTPPSSPSVLCQPSAPLEARRTPGAHSPGAGTSRGYGHSRYVVYLESAVLLAGIYICAQMTFLPLPY